MEALESALQQSPVDGGYGWGAAAFILLEILLVALSQQHPVPAWWHWGTANLRWYPRAAGVGLAAVTAGALFVAAAVRSRAVPRAGSGALQSAIGLVIYLAVAAMLQMASPGAGVYVLLLGAFPLLASVFSGRQEVSSPAWWGLFLGLLVGSLGLWAAHGEYHVQHGAWGS